MAVEIKTAGVKPVRNTFQHLADRFGDKVANRYQEIAFDTQPVTNFHYKPLWAPDQDLYDTSITAITMHDWYALKDPRQYYYGSYTTARAKQQDAIDQQMAFIEKRDLFSLLPDDAKELITLTLVTLRHYEWGANTNNNYIAAYGYGTTITQAATMAMCDRLGMAQHLSRIGLFIDAKTGAALDTARQHWLENPAWQEVRRNIENMFVIKDWFEVMVAQNLVADGLIYPLFFEEFDRHFSRRHGNDLSSLSDYPLTWQKDFSRWVDAVIKTAATENTANKDQLNQWVQQWYACIFPSLTPMAEIMLGEQAPACLQRVTEQFNTRLKKMGLDNV